MVKTNMNKNNLIPLTPNKKEQLHYTLYTILSKLVGYPNNEKTKELVAKEVNKTYVELEIVIP